MPTEPDAPPTGELKPCGCEPRTYCRTCNPPAEPDAQLCFSCNRTLGAHAPDCPEHPSRLPRALPTVPLTDKSDWPRVRCRKCGVTAKENRSKYCGDGSDKDNPHRWEPIAQPAVPPVDEVDDVEAICEEVLATRQRMIDAPFQSVPFMNAQAEHCALANRHAATLARAVRTHRASNEAEILRRIDLALAGHAKADELMRKGFERSEELRGELKQEVRTLRAELAAVKGERDNLQRFKDWVHTYLDTHGVPHHPPGTHGAEGCRIGDRMDWLMAQLADLKAKGNP